MPAVTVQGGGTGAALQPPRRKVVNLAGQKQPNGSFRAVRVLGVNADRKVVWLCVCSICEVIEKQMTVDKFRRLETKCPDCELDARAIQKIKRQFNRVWKKLTPERKSLFQQIIEPRLEQLAKARMTAIDREVASWEAIDEALIDVRHLSLQELKQFVAGLEPTPPLSYAEATRQQSSLHRAITQYGDEGGEW